MNKKIILFFLLIIILVLVGAMVALKLIPGQKMIGQPVNPPQIIINNENDLYRPKPIKLELMTPEEKEAFRIASSTPGRIQVLERDSSGKITAYKIIKADSDILTKYQGLQKLFG